MDLVVAVDGLEWTRVRAPADLGRRAWILGVVAVQLTVTDGQVRAQVRASLTGTEAQLRALGSASIVQMALVEQGSQPTWPTIQPPELEGAAVIQCMLDGEILDRAILSRPQLADDPPRRAFAHAYCRWLRDGSLEPGFDLTDFLSKPPGEMYDRKLHRPLLGDQVVTYAFRTA